MNFPDYLRKGQPKSPLPIEANELTLSVNGERLIESLSLRIEAGEFVAIQGSSGSGKTTLANALMGLAGRDLSIDEGSITWGGADIYKMNEDKRAKLRGRYFGYVPQDHNLIDGLNAQGNILRPHLLMGRLVSGHVLSQGADTIGVADKLQARNAELSGGQKQRINILRGIVSEPDVVVLDEPTSSLQHEMKVDVNDFLSKMSAANNQTVIVITHELTSARRLITLSDGRIVSDESNEKAA
jgi:putative ABC transport system ATP-binding protein